MEELRKKVESVATQEEFVEFVRMLASEFREKGAGWENREVDTFLDAMANWTEDMDGYFSFKQAEIPSNLDWKIFANGLMGATMYE
jgi:hypothetical protein